MNLGGTRSLIHINKIQKFCQSRRRRDRYKFHYFPKWKARGNQLKFNISYFEFNCFEFWRRSCNSRRISSTRSVDISRYNTVRKSHIYRNSHMTGINELTGARLYIYSCRMAQERGTNGGRINAAHTGGA